MIGYKLKTNIFVAFVTAFNLLLQYSQSEYIHFYKLYVHIISINYMFMSDKSNI